MWIDRAVKWLLPREDHFYGFLERGAASARESGGQLAHCCHAATEHDRRASLQRMRAAEGEADRVLAQVFEALNQTFVTPIDRSDIYELATSLQELTERIVATGSKFELHAIAQTPAGACGIAGLIEKACVELHDAVGRLRALKQPDDVRRCCREVSRFKEEGETIFRERLRALFRDETDAIRLIKEKEFLEALAQTLDACDGAGNVLMTIVVKNT